MATSHKEAITAIKYNSSFKQIVTASDGSVSNQHVILSHNVSFLDVENAICHFGNHYNLSFII